MANKKKFGTVYGKTMDVGLSFDEIADVFAEAGSDRQAELFGEMVRALARECGSGPKLDLQIAWIAESLDTNAESFLRKLIGFVDDDKK